MTLVDAGATSGAAGASDGRPMKDGPPEQALPDTLAMLVQKRWKDAGDELAGKRREWWQNLSFTMGEQWVWWDKKRNTLQQLPQTYSPLGPGKAKVVVNRMGSNVRSLLSRLMRNVLEFDVPPSSPSDDVMAASLLAEDVCTGSYHDNDWRGVRLGALFAAFMGGTSAVAIEWDGSAGTTLAVDDETGIVTGTGEVVLTPLNITEFALEPGVRKAKQARWWIQAFALAPDVVRAQYKLGWKPMRDASALMSPMQQRLLQSMGRTSGGDLTLVLVMYERPNVDQKQGRVVHVVNGRVVDKSDWPFPWADLNLEVFHCDEIQGSWVGRTFLCDAVGVQTAYNHIRSVIAEQAKKTGNARLMAAEGSLVEEDVTDDQNSILFYMPDIGGAKPEYLSAQFGESSRGLQAESAALAQELDDLMHVHDTSRGEAVGDRTSGQALALLSDKDDSPLGLMAFEQAQGWGAIATKVLQVYEKKVPETREVTVPTGIGEGPSTYRIRKWSGRKLRGQTRVFVPLDSVMPMTQAALQQMVDNLWINKVITDPVVYAKMLRLPTRDLETVSNADVGRATRENVRMQDGEPEMPQHFDDHATHIAEHNRHRKSDAYQYAPDDIKRIFDDHVQAHENFAHEEAAEQMARSAVMPGLASLPQAHEPAGSLVPPDFAEQRSGQVSAQEADAMAKVAAATGGDAQPAPGGAIAPAPGAGDSGPPAGAGQTAPAPIGAP